MTNDYQPALEKILKNCLKLIIAVYVINFFILGFKIGPYDYDHLSGYLEIAWHFWRTASSKIAQYNPYLCGGRTLAGDPQIPIYSFLPFLVPLIGPTLLIKWELLAQLVLGTYGLFKILSFYGSNKVQTLWGIFLFVTGGATVAKFMVGHVTLGFYLLYPLFLHLSYQLAHHQGKDRYRALIYYWCLFVYCCHYKPNFLIYGAPPLLIEVAARSFFQRKMFPLVAFVVGIIFGALINAPALLPSAIYFAANPRLDGSEPRFFPWYCLFFNLILPLKAIPKILFGNNILERHEYNFFIGPFALFFSWLGIQKLWRVKTPESKALFLFLGASFLLGLGSSMETVQPLLPFSWLRPLWPGFKSIRVPTRFWFGVYLTLIVFASFGLRIPKTLRQFRVFFVFGILPLMLVAMINLSKTTVFAKYSQWVGSRLYPPEIIMEKTSATFSYPFLRQGMGVLECVENISIYRSKKLQNGNSLDRIETKGNVNAHWADWNRIFVQAAGKNSFDVDFNLNHSDYWRFEGERGKVSSQPGHPLRLTVFDTSVSGELVFRQAGMRESLVLGGISLFLFIALIAFLWRKSREN